MACKATGGGSRQQQCVERQARVRQKPSQGTFPFWRQPIQVATRPKPASQDFPFHQGGRREVQCALCNKQASV